MREISFVKYVLKLNNKIKTNNYNKEREKMRYKFIKKAGIEISTLSVGTWAIGGENYGSVDEKDSIEAIRAMIDGGVTVVDTAPVYGNGQSELLVGKALKDGYREKVYLATKFGVACNPAGGDLIRRANYQAIIEDCEGSMKRIGTDFIDIYIMHWPDINTSIEETMAAVNALKKQGKIRFAGVSNFTREMLDEALKYGEIEFVQPPYSMVNESMKELLLFCEKQGIGTMTYGSLGSGILTGAIREKPNFDKDDYRLTFYDVYAEPKFSKIMELLKILDKIAAAHNKPVAQVAINWSTQKSYVSTAICGVRNVAEAQENRATFDWMLSDEEVNMIDKELLRLVL